MTQVHHIFCALYFYYYICLRSSGIRPQRLDPCPKQQRGHAALTIPLLQVVLKTLPNMPVNREHQSGNQDSSNFLQSCLTLMSCQSWSKSFHFSESQFPCLKSNQIRMISELKWIIYITCPGRVEGSRTRVAWVPLCALPPDTQCCPISLHWATHRLQAS